MDSFEYIEDAEYYTYTVNEVLHEGGYESLREFYEDYYGEGCEDW